MTSSAGRPQFRCEFLDERVVRLRVTLDRDVAIAEMGVAASPPRQAKASSGWASASRGAITAGTRCCNWIEDAYFDPRPGHDWTYWPVPFFLSSRGYGVLLDTTRRGTSSASAASATTPGR